MHVFEEAVVKFAEEHLLFPHPGKVIAAFSGGGDSTALLKCLVEIAPVFGLAVEAAHLNHSLRGEESDGDEAFARETCGRLGVRLSVERLTDGGPSRRGESLETAARRGRRTFLERVARERRAYRIALGHTLDDQAETVLQRLIRGTGPAGLAGIAPSDGELRVYPLLGTTRKSAREYLLHAGIEWREDSSNTDTAFFRNRIRHILLPLLESEFSPGCAEALARLADLCRADEEYFDRLTVEALSACALHSDDGKILLDGETFERYHISLRRRMARACLERLEGTGRDTDMREISRILALAETRRGGLDVTARIRCEAAGGLIAFAVRGEESEPSALAIPGETAVPGGGALIARGTGAAEQPDGVESIAVSAEVTAGYGPLTVGTVKRGEYMILSGMRSPVKISDILSRRRIPKVFRNTVPVVRAGGVPVWIPGIRSAECVRRCDESTGGIVIVYRGGPDWRALLGGRAD